ncbi:MAG TPA: hypothetical protein VJ754_11775, partial [Anaerolineae bacterium]|nr:hypothetical protein [Anaerolineae bacterium]
MNSKPAAADKLLKILKLEADTGYRDRAVIGGLAQFAERWRDEAQQDRIDPDRIDAVAAHLRAYPGLADAAARRRSIQALLELLAQLAANAPAPPALASETGEPAGEASLEHLEIDPLRPLNNLMSGAVQAKPPRLEQAPREVES